MDLYTLAAWLRGQPVYFVLNGEYRVLGRGDFVRPKHLPPDFRVTHNLLEAQIWAEEQRREMARWS